MNRSTHQTNPPNATAMWTWRDCRISCVGVFVFAILCSFQSATGQPTTGQTVKIVDVEGRVTTGELQQFAGDKIVIRNPQRRDFDTSDVLTLEFSTHSSKPNSRGSIIFLANGDRLMAVPTAMNDERLAAHWQGYPVLKPLSIPLETIRGILVNIPEIPSVKSKGVRDLLENHGENDAVVFMNGDRAEGELLEINRNVVVFQSAVGKTSLDRNRIRAIAFNSELMSFPRIEGKYALIMLTDGSRISGRNLQMMPTGQLRVKAIFGVNLQIPLASVASLQFFGGRAMYLSDLKPAEYRFTPYLSTEWTMRNNRNVNGGPLSLRGVEYAKGVGLHSRCEVSYELSGKFQTFRATVGIDDDAKGRGHAVFAVNVDGKRVFTSQSLTGKDTAYVISPIKISKARRLTLIVDYGKFGDIRDFADWCNAVLIR